MEMLELKSEETALVGAGVQSLSTHTALSTLSGTVIGGGIGTAIAFNMAIPTASLFPIWLAACTGAGGAIGTLVGIAYAVGSYCSGCFCPKN